MTYIFEAHEYKLIIIDQIWITCPGQQASGTQFAVFVFLSTSFEVTRFAAIERETFVSTR